MCAVSSSRAVGLVSPGANVEPGEQRRADPEVIGIAFILELIQPRESSLNTANHGSLPVLIDHLKINAQRFSQAHGSNGADRGIATAE